VTRAAARVDGVEDLVVGDLDVRHRADVIGGHAGERRQLGDLVVLDRLRGSLRDREGDRQTELRRQGAIGAVVDEVHRREWCDAVRLQVGDHVVHHRA
jgi:hypothetical protein